MEKKEVFETLKEGLMTQFEELGKEIGVDENSADVARARLETAEHIIALEQLIEENKCGVEEEFKFCESTFSLENISTDELINELEKRVTEDLKDLIFNPVG